MSMLDNTNTEYTAAADKYKQLQSQYTGEAGYTNASKQATQAASQAGQVAGANALSAARTAGMSKAQAAATGASNASKETLNTFSNAQSSAITNNNNTMNAQKANMDYGKDTDNIKQQNNERGFNVATNAIGGVAAGVAQSLSDKNKKCIKWSSRDEKCDELLKKLRGE